MEQQITRGNQLIAQFMGNITNDSKEWVVTNKSFVGEYQYHKSWDWLMSVVEKIENLTPHGYRFMISTKSVRVYTCKKSFDDWDEYNCTVFDGKLNCTWQAVVEFIEWYNLKQQQ